MNQMTQKIKQLVFCVFIVVSDLLFFSPGFVHKSRFFEMVQLNWRVFSLACCLEEVESRH